MLLYQFPPKMSRTEKVSEKLQIDQNNKKLKRNLLKNIIIAIIVIGVSITSKTFWIIILLILISLYLISISYYVFKSSYIFPSDLIYTKIYEDRIVHSQQSKKPFKIEKYTIYFDDIYKTINIKGKGFKIFLNEENSSVLLKNDKSENKILTAELNFKEYSAKKHINDFYWDKLKIKN